MVKRTLVGLVAALSAPLLGADTRAETPEPTGEATTETPMQTSVGTSADTPGDEKPATPLPFSLSFEVGGGSVVRWSAADETGNAFGGLVVLTFDAFAVGLGAAAVMPDSRLQANFTVLWAEGRFTFLETPVGGLKLSPYATLGVGYALEDKAAPSVTGFLPARWSREGSPVVLAGAGVRYGADDGMYLAAEARAFNHTHLGLQILVGYALW